MLTGMTQHMGGRPVGPRPDRRKIGQLGEDLVADHLQRLGWTVVQRNWRTRHGEIDLIAVDGTTLVIVEVKTRASHFYGASAAVAVTPEKLARMRRLARLWLAEQEHWWPRVRFDVVAVQLDSSDPEDLERAGVEHLRGVVE